MPAPGADGGQSPACAQYVDCYYRTGGTIGSLNSTYGPGGTCWTSTAAGNSCTSACCSAFLSLQTAYPNAGCGSGIPFDAGPPPVCSPPVGTDGGQSTSCVDYVDCYHRTGGTIGSLDSTYGPGGTCWTSSPATASSCTSACCSAYASLTAAYPNAGCGSGTPFDAGPGPMSCGPPVGFDGGISAACTDYVYCFDLTSGTTGSLNGSYGPGGTCWTTSSAASSACTSACCTAIASLKAAYPDAGCR